MSFELTKLIVPSVADVKDTVQLSCQYELGVQKLNSVKWYKDNDEFFRYSPMTYPIFKTFPVEGVYVATDRSTICNNEECTIYLGHLNSKTGGTYSCEVSGDAPAFKLIQERANMTMALLPRYNPFITIKNRNYMLGDWVTVNCTSDVSHPLALLSWFINEDKVANDFVHPYQEKTMESKGLLIGYSSLELRFRLDQSHLIKANDRQGKIRLKCLSIIEQLPMVSKVSYQTISVSSGEDLSSQMLKFWRSSGENVILCCN